MKVPKVSLKLLKKLLLRKANSSPESTTIPQEEELSPKNKNKSPPPPPLEECPICHDPVGLTNPEGIVEAWTSLHCGHKFGTHCIQTWLQESINRDPTTSPSCPICRSTAKHPCGHLISPPPSFPTIHLNWQYPRAPPQPPRHHQIRRRLTRRPGHPLRPPPQEPEVRRAPVVGECRACVDNAEFDARMRRIAEQRTHHQQRRGTGESSMTTGSRSAAAAVAIKNIIPSLKRSTNSRTTIVHVGVEPRSDDEDRGLDIDLEETGRRRGRHHLHIPPHRHNRGSMLYAMPRRPTPPPGYSSRRLSI